MFLGGISHQPSAANRRRSSGICLMVVSTHHACSDGICRRSHDLPRHSRVDSGSLAYILTDQSGMGIYAWFLRDDIGSGITLISSNHVDEIGWSGIGDVFIAQVNKK